MQSSILLLLHFLTACIEIKLSILHGVRSDSADSHHRIDHEIATNDENASSPHVQLQPYNASHCTDPSVSISQQHISWHNQTSKFCSSVPSKYPSVRIFFTFDNRPTNRLYHCDQLTTKAAKCDFAWEPPGRLFPMWCSMESICFSMNTNISTIKLLK